MAQIPTVELIEDYVPVTEREELQEIPNKIRFLVEGSPNLESKIATLQKFYPKVEVDTQQNNNFIVTDDGGRQFQLDNKKEFTFGDVIDVSKEITEIFGAIGGATTGAVGGTAVAPGVGTVAGGIAGAGAGTAAGAEVFERVAQQFGSEILRTNKEHASQRMTDFAFGSVAQLVTPIIGKAIKGSITGFGKTGKKTLDRLKNYIDAGVTPSLGQVTQKQGIQTVEMIIGNIPGGSGRISDVAQLAQDQLGKKALNLASKTINKTLPADEVAVGRVINQGIKNGVDASDGFVGRFQAKSGTLYGELDQYLKPKAPIKLDQTVAKLKDLVSPVKGAEKTSIVFKNQFLDDVLKGLESDLAKNSGALPYQAVKSVKGKIGNKLGSFDLVNPVDKAQLKTIYGTLSEDIKLALKGNTKGLNALSRANNYYNSGLKRIDNYLEPISKTADPDRIASILINSGKEGASRLNAVKKSLNKDQYNVFLSNVLERMGRLQPGQALSGDVLEGSGKFSSETFLTNYNKLSEAAKESLFKGKGWTSGMKKEFDDMLKISNFIRQSGKTFRNPSGTADRLIGQGIIFGGAAGGFVSNPAFALIGLPLVIGGSKVVASLMTNPAFIKWLAQGIKISGNKGVDGVLQHLGRLGVIMGNADSESRQFINEYLQMLMSTDKKN
mgnify:FL=1|tara:strand:- start:53 stop:2053 length:2001 start_codon:yes stop_codon:yes gene_type:complete